jgi:hypothetical protein
MTGFHTTSLAAMPECLALVIGGAFMLLARRRADATLARFQTQQKGNDVAS